MPTERKFLCSVYVVLLNAEVVNTPQIKRRNPKRDPLKPCVYVGLTDYVLTVTSTTAGSEQPQRRGHPKNMAFV